MKVKFEGFFRGFVIFLVLTLAWSVWSGAQPITNKTAVAAPDQSSVLVRDVQCLETHPLTFGLDKIAPLREVTALGEPLWKYLASVIYVLLAFFLSRLIDFVTSVWLKKLTSKTETKLDDLLLALLHGPIKVIVFVVLLNIGLNIFDWSPATKLYLSKGLILIVAASLTYLAVKLVNLLLEVWKQRNVQDTGGKFDDQLFSVIRISLDTFVIIVAVLVTAQNMSIDITAAIASLSVGGLAVGLAAQDTLANLFGAIAVFIDKPFRVGDQVKLEGAEGVVENVGLRSTRLRNPDGHLVAVPNKTMGNATIVNITRRPTIKTVMNLALAPDTSVAKIKEVLAFIEEIYRSHPMTQDAWISFNQFAGPNINIVLMHWWNGTDYQKHLAGVQQMNLAIKERLDASGIRLALKP